MLKDDLAQRICHHLGHTPTEGQAEAARQWADFLLAPLPDEVCLLTGYAGTGKTSLVSALVKTLAELHRPVVLLAPTGRAAKVFSLYASAPAYTIHRRIYRQRSFTPAMNNFDQTPNTATDTLFLVDEASMIANEGLSGGYFGTGRLLDDLVHYVYAGRGCRLLLVGDTAQLPPVGEELSPALMPEALRAYDLQVLHLELTEVVRQGRQSGILSNATYLRQLLSRGELHAFPRMRLSAFPDVVSLPGSELIDALESSYYHCGADQTIVVTRSNRRANLYNNGIRSRIRGAEELLEQGDQLIIAKNNYYWTERFRAERARDNEPPLPLPFIANGDVATVRRLRHHRELYGFHFADATLRFPDYDNLELTLTLLLDTLQAEAPALTREQQETLCARVCEDWPEITSRRALMQQVKNDAHYNALQVKYAYAVTCHKAQGGQWQHVYIDQGYLTEEMLTPDYFRWLYTALTRATERVYLVNWPREQTDGEE